MNLAQAMARALAVADVDHVFTLMGNGNLRLVHHLVEDHGIRVHHLRHEAAAVGAADGYARATRRVGIATVTHGPGFTNSLTTLVTAQRARTAVVLLTSDSSGLPAAAHPFAATQALDPDVLLGPLDIRTVRVTIDRGYADLLEAIGYADLHRTVVVAVVGAGEDAKEFTGKFVRRSSGEEPAPRPHDAGVVSSTDLNAAVDTLVKAERPVVLAGRGAVLANAGDAIERLSAQLDLPLATTIKAAGMFTGNPMSIGVAGGFSTPRTADLLRTTDCVVAFGAGLNHFTTLRRSFFRDACLIQVDADPRAFGKYVEPQIRILGDARQAAISMSRAISDRHVPAVDRVPTPIETLTSETTGAYGGLDPRELCRELDRLLPAERTTVIDAGHFSAFPIMNTTLARDAGLVWPIDFGAVGSSIGAAIGAAVGRPERLTVLFIGDGGLFMTLGDFEAAARERLPLVVVCMNDHAYGSECVHLEEARLPDTEALFDAPPISGIATALGFQSSHITALAQVAAALDSWDPGYGPLLLDCEISRAVRSPIYAHI